jgi:hypothetical protein
MNGIKERLNGKAFFSLRVYVRTKGKPLRKGGKKEESKGRKALSYLSGNGFPVVAFCFPVSAFRMDTFFRIPCKGLSFFGCNAGKVYH